MPIKTIEVKDDDGAPCKLILDTHIVKNSEENIRGVKVYRYLNGAENIRKQINLEVFSTKKNRALYSGESKNNLNLDTNPNTPYYKLTYHPSSKQSSNQTQKPPYKLIRYKNSSSEGVEIPIDYVCGLSAYLGLEKKEDEFYTKNSSPQKIKISKKLTPNKVEEILMQYEGMISLYLEDKKRGKEREKNKNSILKRYENENQNHIAFEEIGECEYSAEFNDGKFYFKCIVIDDDYHEKGIGTHVLRYIYKELDGFGNGKVLMFVPWIKNEASDYWGFSPGGQNLVKRGRRRGIIPKDRCITDRKKLPHKMIEDNRWLPSPNASTPASNAGGEGFTFPDSLNLSLNSSPDNALNNQVMTPPTDSKEKRQKASQKNSLENYSSFFNEKKKKTKKKKSHDTTKNSHNLSGGKRKREEEEKEEEEENDDINRNIENLEPPEKIQKIY